VGDPAPMLCSVSWVAVDAVGSVYVALPVSGTIRVYDSVGRGLYTFGRRGSEPGQFQRIYNIGIHGDTLYAIDLGSRRIEYFTLQGELLESVQVSPPPVSPPFFPSMPFAVFPDGSRAIGTSFPANMPAEALMRVPQLRMDAAGTVVDTVTWIGYERAARRVPYEDRPMAVGSPLSDDAFAIFAPDGSRIVTVDRTVAAGATGATFGVTVSDGWGDTIYSRRYDYEPLTINAAVIDTTVVERANVIEGAFENPSAARGFGRGTMFLPVYYPPVSTAAFSPSGTLWLKREDIRGQRQTWWILDDTGEPVAPASLPAGFQILVVGDDALWGLEYGDAPNVVRYRIVR
jgi:hypothetical protein